MARHHTIPPDARPLCVLSWRFAFHHLCMAGPILCVWCNARGPDEAPLHHGGLCQLRVADSSSRHFHQKMDRETWGQTMANAAPPDLCQRSGRRNPLLLARKTGCSAAPSLCRHSGSAAFVPCLAVCAPRPALQYVVAGFSPGSPTVTLWKRGLKPAATYIHDSLVTATDKFVKANTYN